MAQMSITLNVTPDEMETIHTALERLAHDEDLISPWGQVLRDKAKALLEAFPRRAE